MLRRKPSKKVIRKKKEKVATAGCVKKPGEKKLLAFVRLRGEANSTN